VSASDHLNDIQFSAIDRRPGKQQWRIRATRGTQQVGRLYWRDTEQGPEVGDVLVHPDYRRQGVASEMYRRASEHSGALLGHSTIRTGAGDAWARAIGGPLPERAEGWLD
jgi:GNAT superfamily N-acetyltransferase